MPNWSSNLLKVKGTKAHRDAFAADMAAFVKAKIKKQVQEWKQANPNSCSLAYEKSVTPTFDFNFVIPMPEELEGTVSPRPLTREEIIELAKEHNWKEEDLKWRLESALTDEDAARLNELKSRFGFDNWYDWCLSNWGTKWNACHSDWDIEESSTMHMYRFDTAWSPPEPVIHALAIAYPNLTFRLEYTLEGERGRWSITGDPEKYKGCIKALKERNEQMAKVISSLLSLVPEKADDAVIS
jgi:hypothetical protein